jgi:hypothetical protein
MQIGLRLLVKHEGIIKEGTVIDFSFEDLDIKLDDGTIIRRKFWEIRKIEIKNDM